ncbi:MAG: hypothetical protein U0074_14100 [Kouleothrix sp.]
MAEATERRYFARVSAGLEQVAWDDIAQRTGARLLGMGHRRLDFAYAGPPAVLLTLRSVDDVYALVARLNGLDHTRASLPRLSKKIAALDFGSALAAVEAARALPEYPKYRYGQPPGAAQLLALRCRRRDRAGAHAAAALALRAERRRRA